jgi:hypothetical protein
LSNNIEANRAEFMPDWDFESDDDYHAFRDSIGGLTLLPRGRNRSLRDKPYSAKTQIYSTENILCQSLQEAFLQNNPTAVEGLKGIGVELKAYQKFNKQAISERTQFYSKIASLIWSKEQLNLVQ